MYLPTVHHLLIKNQRILKVNRNPLFFDFLSFFIFTCYVVTLDTINVKANSTSISCLLYTSIAHMANDGNFLLYSLLIVYYSKSLGLGIAFLGIGPIAVNLISGVLTGPIGLYAQRSGRIGTLIAIGIMLEGVSAVMFSLPFFYLGLSYWFIFTAAGILGIGQAFYHPLGASLLNTTYGTNKAPRYLGINGSMGSIGRAIFPLIIGGVVLLFGYGRGIQVVGIIALAFSLVIYAGLREFNSVKKMSSSGPRNASQKVSLGKYRSFIYYFTAVVFLRSAFYLGTTTYLADYVTSIINSPFLTTVILTVAFIPPIIGQPIFGNMVIKKGGRFVNLLTGYFSVLAFALFMLTNNEYLLTVLLGAYAFVAFTGFPVMLGYVGQKVPKEILPFSNSLVWGIGNTIGSSAGVGLMVLLISFESLALSFWVMILVGLISIVAFQFGPRKAREPEDIEY